eukprot:RCo012389
MEATEPSAIAQARRGVVELPVRLEGRLALILIAILFLGVVHGLRRSDCPHVTISHSYQNLLGSRGSLLGPAEVGDHPAARPGVLGSQLGLRAHCDEPHHDFLHGIHEEHLPAGHRNGQKVALAVKFSRDHFGSVQAVPQDDPGFAGVLAAHQPQRARREPNGKQAVACSVVHRGGALPDERLELQAVLLVIPNSQRVVRAHCGDHLAPLEPGTSHDWPRMEVRDHGGGRGYGLDLLCREVQAIIPRQPHPKHNAVAAAHKQRAPVQANPHRSDHFCAQLYCGFQRLGGRAVEPQLPPFRGHNVVVLADHNARQRVW